uniref:exo-alpha-sialidase n=1 Tax=Pelusios castaneus TaxID=367368 RepID=A0A8C8S9S3_9SAUR
MTQASVTSGKVTLFPRDPQSGDTYQIPALLFIPPDTFLAFAERRSSVRDKHAEHLVLRRGMKKGDSIELPHSWGPTESLTSAVLPGHRTMNPCPVYERKSQTVFLFFICVEGTVTERWQILTGQNAARLCYVCSGDAGQTWSSLTDLTEQVIGEDLRDWATFAVGPGHGVQLCSGRLVIPAYVYHITARCCRLPLPGWTLPHALIFYSDDGGQLWHKGELIQGMRTLECEVAEVVCQNGDSVLYCSARTPGRCRAETHSADQGLKFESPSPCSQLCEPPRGCQGSVNRCLRALSWLLYSHPTGKYKREDLGIYLNTSPLEEAKWEAPWVLHTGPSGYSDLAVCQGPPLLFGCLFECGKAHPYEEIAFQLFTDQELQNNRGSPHSSEQQPKAKLKFI